MKPLWPVWKQIADRDLSALGASARSERSEQLAPRTRSAEKIVDIEGDLDSPISRGRLCPTSAATSQLVTGSHRVHKVLYRRPHAADWETIPLERAMDMVAARVAMERESARVPRVDKSLHEGVAGTLWKAAKAAAASSPVISPLPGQSRGKRLAAGVLGTIGVVCLRFAGFHAGRASSLDPRATFHQQRAGCPE